VYLLAITNGSASPLDGLMLQTNRSSFGLAPGDVVLQVASIPPGGSAQLSVPMVVDPAKVAPLPASPKLELAMKTNQAGVLYFADNVPLGAVLQEDGAIEGAAFLSSWRSLPPEQTAKLGCSVVDVEVAKARLAAANLFVLAHRPVPGTPQQALYLTGRVQGVQDGGQLLLEIRLVPGTPGVDVSFKSERADLGAMVFEAVAQVLA
jgi:hypothetical protein